MNSFIKHSLPAFARANPQIEINVSPRPRKHPVIRGTYINGKERSVCVRNQEKEQILQRTGALRDASGEKNKRTTKKVFSVNESVRGIWSPFHGSGVGQSWSL